MVVTSDRTKEASLLEVHDASGKQNNGREKGQDDQSRDDFDKEW
jgi:hypothetical protein